MPIRHIIEIWQDLLEARNGLPSTRYLKSKQPGQHRLTGDVVVQTKCRSTGCEDSLFWQGRALIAPTPVALSGDGANSTSDRYVKVTWHSADFLSIYVLTQSYQQGAAHFVYDLHCRTFRRGQVKPLQLSELLGKKSSQWLQRKPADQGRGLARADRQDFRLDYSPTREDLARIVLCEQGESGDSSAVREVPIDAVPIDAVPAKLPRR